MTNKVVYIDGDILPYRVGFATQHTVYVCEMEGLNSGVLLVTRQKREVNKYKKLYPDLLVSELFFVEDVVQATMTLQLMLHTIVQGSGCNTFKVVMSGDTNFRTDIATIQKYKGNRDGIDKPVHWEMLRDWLLDKPYTIVTDNEEADDELSRQCLAGNMISTLDKDLNNTPGWHYNFVKKEKYYVTEEEAIRNFYTQTLVGDIADNIPGIKGIGPVKAARILDGAIDAAVIGSGDGNATAASLASEGAEPLWQYQAREMERAVLEVYEAHYDDARAALTEVGTLLWMRRSEGEVFRLGGMS